MEIDFFRRAISLNNVFKIVQCILSKFMGGGGAQRTLSSMAVHSTVILLFCKDFNFMMINYIFTIQDALHFAFLYFE